MRDYQESLNTGQTDTRTDRQTPDKMIPICWYAVQVTQKASMLNNFHNVYCIESQANITISWLDLTITLFKYIY